ncbi:glycoside hydrolase [Flavobacteriaceae bacterium F89]|uniref:exo-alpha-sialidase n=1 Tax=Cerina litoralis TaxID=2874477 RepID=A0AAE3EVG5_9FLAO|nr:sialidase family protein [Cerina litoralis]MCG2461028.1 glycoside hydrolase [Cerina litoralis]
MNPKLAGLTLFVAILITSCKKTKEPVDPITLKVLWSTEDTSHNNYRIPSIIVSKKNTVLAFSEGREGGDTGDIDILLRRSLDNGKTWEKQIVVWDDSANTCGNPCPVIDRSTGRIILLMTWNLGSDHETDIIRKKSENTRVPYMTYSDDDGVTWSAPQNLSESCKNEDWGWYATGPGVGIQMKSEKYRDRLIIPCNNSYDNPEMSVRDGFGYGSHVLLSDDGGTNWRMGEIITPEVNESQIVELNDGTLMMNMRSYNGKSSRAVSFSHDGGETWSAIEHDPQLVEPICQGGIINYGNYKEENMYLFSNPSVPFDRTHMTIKASFDECKTWSNSKLVYPGPSAYSCLTKLPNGNVGIFFEGGVQNAYEKMIFVSFAPEQIFKPGTAVDHFSRN